MVVADTVSETTAKPASTRNERPRCVPGRSVSDPRTASAAYVGGITTEMCWSSDGSWLCGMMTGAKKTT